MKLEYAEIIYDIVEKGLDVKQIVYLLENHDAKQVHKLVWELRFKLQEHNYIYDSCKDLSIKEASLFPISNGISEIQKEIAEL